jgi:hypothetical protein
VALVSSPDARSLSASAYSGGFFVLGVWRLAFDVRRRRAGLPLVLAQGDILNVGVTHVAGDLRA